MNPFVNPKKRGFTLPKDCKDLADVLNGPKNKQDERGQAVRRFIALLLLQAQQDGFTEIVIGPARESGTTLKHKAGGAWCEMSAFPSEIRAEVVAEIGRMARLPPGQFPKAGVLGVAFADRPAVKWKVEMKGADGDCTLIRLEA
jgi:hypothetical protein